MHTYKLYLYGIIVSVIVRIGIIMYFDFQAVKANEIANYSSRTTGHHTGDVRYIKNN